MQIEVLGERYQLQEPIGRGGMATIYRGRDMRMERVVAIKVLREVYSTDPKFVTRFQREAKAASVLQHPNIVQVYDYGQTDGNYFIVMELIEGTDLRRYLRSRGMLAVDRAVIIAHDVALGLGAAHRRNIVRNPRLIEQVHADEALFIKNEKLADAFAAALLMPQQMIDIDVRGKKLTYSFVVALARKYRVSTIAMLWRLCYLRIISRESVDLALADEDFKQLDHATFKDALQSSHPFDNRFLRLAYLAHEKGRLSKGRLAQMLNVKLLDVNQYLVDRGLYLTDDKEIETTHTD